MLKHERTAECVVAEQLSPELEGIGLRTIDHHHRTGRSRAHLMNGARDTDCVESILGGNQHRIDARRHPGHHRSRPRGKRGTAGQLRDVGEDACGHLQLRPASYMIPVQRLKKDTFILTIYDLIGQ